MPLRPTPPPDRATAPLDRRCYQYEKGLWAWQGETCDYLHKFDTPTLVYKTLSLRHRLIPEPLWQLDSVRRQVYSQYETRSR